MYTFPLRYFSSIKTFHNHIPLKVNYLQYDSPNPNVQLNLILIHGLLGTLHDFKYIIKHPDINTKANCICMELRNHGKSPHTPLMSLGDMAADIEYLIQNLQLENVVLLGHSLGARVAMEAALNYRKLIKAVVPVDALPFRYYEHKERYPIVNKMERNINYLTNLNLNRSMKDIINDLKVILNNEGSLNYVLQNIEKIQENQYKWSHNMKYIAENFIETSNQEIYREPRGRFTGDYTIIFGEKSNFLSNPEDLETFKGVFLDYQYYDKNVNILPGGHHMYLTHPEPFIQCVSKFLTRVNDKLSSANEENHMVYPDYEK